MFSIKVYKSSNFNRSIDINDKNIRANIAEEKVFLLFGVPVLNKTTFSDCISIAPNGPAASGGATIGDLTS